MHDKTLTEYLSSSSAFASRLEERANPNKFYVFNVNLPDTFHELKGEIMRYFEDSGYRCDKEVPAFEPDSRTLFYKDSDNKKVLNVMIKHERFGNEREMGRAQVIVRRRRSVK